MKHTAKTDEEIEKEGLLPEGIYDFTIAHAEEKVSSSGNDMFALKHHVYDPKGEARVVYDWVLPEFPKKHKHLHDSLGLFDLYQSGETKAEDLIGKSGKLKLGIGEPYKDKNGIMRINNSVVEYIKKNNMVPVDNTVEEDEIPF